ncbi:MAG: hypothetical protein K8U57_33325 [Planctomycetes bacterium]|nr:hypothetical protein [Planctomycetota bacterium]
MRAAIALGLIVAFGCSKKPPQTTKVDFLRTPAFKQSMTQEVVDKSLDDLMKDSAAETQNFNNLLIDFDESAPDQKERHRTAILVSLNRQRQLWDKQVEALRRLSPSVKPETIKLIEDKLKNAREAADAMEAKVRQ